MCFCCFASHIIWIIIIIVKDGFHLFLLFFFLFRLNIDRSDQISFTEHYCLFFKIGQWIPMFSKKKLLQIIQIMLDDLFLDSQKSVYLRIVIVHKPCDQRFLLSIILNCSTIHGRGKKKNNNNSKKKKYYILCFVPKPKPIIQKIEVERKAIYRSLSAIKNHNQSSNTIQSITNFIFGIGQRNR